MSQTHYPIGWTRYAVHWTALWRGPYNTWYQEPFCPHMGPYQTLRADTWWTLLLVFFRFFFIFRRSGNHLNDVQNIGHLLFLKTKAPAKNAPVVVRARSSENRRMFLPNIEEPLGAPFWKQILMKWIYYKGKMKSQFYSENLDQTGKYHGESTFWHKT